MMTEPKLLILLILGDSGLLKKYKIEFTSKAKSDYYNMLENSMRNHENYISYNYYGTKRTYKEFIAQIDKCARALKSLGVKATERVSICMPNTPEAIIAFYAINWDTSRKKL